MARTTIHKLNAALRAAARQHGLLEVVETVPGYLPTPSCRARIARQLVWDGLAVWAMEMYPSDIRGIIDPKDFRDVPNQAAGYQFPHSCWIRLTSAGQQLPEYFNAPDNPSRAGPPNRPNLRLNGITYRSTIPRPEFRSGGNPPHW